MLKKFAVICTLMLCVLVAGCSDDQTATVIPQPETKQTQNNKNLVNSSPQDTAKMVSLFPKGTKIRTMKIEDGTAYVDFSKEITNVPQGSYTELMLTTAIVNTLTEFPEIKKVQILVDGKKIASLKGHTDILDPLERNTTLLKK